MLKTVPLEKKEHSVGVDSYFHGFMKDCLGDLKNKGETIVFNQDHVEYIKKIYSNVVISKTIDGFLKITIDNNI